MFSRFRVFGDLVRIYFHVLPKHSSNFRAILPSGIVDSIPVDLELGSTVVDVETIRWVDEAHEPIDLIPRIFTLVAAEVENTPIQRCRKSFPT